MLSFASYQAEFLTFLEKTEIPKTPNNLYDPIHYILNLGGKRLRPVLTLMTANAFNCDYKNAMPAALAVEIFHNFSLVHDDIMDEAPLRRGKRTVHEKWNLNTGILSGDAMLILAYQLFENYEHHTFKKLAQLFSKTALEVCEGQQYDIDFETQEEVSLPEYLQMIRYKTAVLVAAAMKMGAIVANATNSEAERIYEFGLNLGLAFQIQDDFLDVFGDPESFGKQLGGDIIENKKTFLYLTALQHASPEKKKVLELLFSNSAEYSKDKIKTVIDIYRDCNVVELTKQKISHYTNLAFKSLNALTIKEEYKTNLKNFGMQLMERTM